MSGGGSSESTMDAVTRLLTTTRTWAVVGCSPDPARDSHRVASRLQSWGFRVIPVNPAMDEVLGERCWPSLDDIPPDEAIDVVDVFRRSAAAGAVVDQAIERKVTGVWLQLGVIDQAAADRAAAAGLAVVMNRCPLIEYPRLQSR
jgi:uncharacterized protein